jgi:hypothetical protein
MTGSVEGQIDDIARAGFDGVEGIPAGYSPSEYGKMLSDAGLQLIAGVFTNTPKEYERELERVIEYNPLKIDAHSGRDCMTKEEGCAFFEKALQKEAQLGVIVGHETHRGRMFFTPWDTAFYLRKFPQLRITADFSHWVNVCERLPDDQQESLELACQRTVHIHGRVGYEEGPQVPDPSDLQYSAQIAWHDMQWDKIRNIHQSAGAEYLTFTPEYGPPGYLHSLPHTGMPVADIWKVCADEMQRIRKRWGQIGN